MKYKREPAPGGLIRPTALIRWAFFASLLAILWLTVNYSSLGEYFEARSHRNENKREVKQLEHQIAELEAQKKQLETWGFPAEKAIRERYKMAKPGETVIIIEDQQKTNSSGRDSKAK